MNKEYQFEIIPKNLDLAGNASSFIKKTLTELKIDRNIIRRVSIATYEAEINVVIHSFGGECRFIIKDDILKVIFKDYGPGIASIDFAMMEGTSTAPKYAVDSGFGAGMGLPNMKKVSDAFNITSNEKGTLINLEFNLKRTNHES